MSFNTSFKLVERLVSDKLHSKIQNADIALKHIKVMFGIFKSCVLSSVG